MPNGAKMHVWFGCEVWLQILMAMGGPGLSYVDLLSMVCSNGPKITCRLPVQNGAKMHVFPRREC